MDTFPKGFKKDIEKAIKILKSYGCTEIYIFGSIVNGKFNEDSDIDIAVKGLKDEYFFKAFAELERELFYQIDLIDLDDSENRFAQFILARGGMIKVA